MGCIYSKCMDKKGEDEDDAIALGLEDNSKPLINNSPGKYLKSPPAYAKLMSSQSKNTLTDITSDKKNFNLSDFNSEDKVSHAGYDSFNSPRFSLKPVTSNLLLESITLDEETKNNNNNSYMNYDYANNTSVLGRLSNYEDKNFEGNYDQSFNDSYMETDNKQLSLDYVSMSNNSIINDNSNLGLNNQENDEFYDLKNVSNVLLRKNYIVVYFELYYFMLWGGEYIKSVYPENNLVIFVQLNDDPSTCEKIYLTKSEEKCKYKPMLKKEDQDKKCYRLIKFLLDETTDSLEKKPIKLAIEIFIYSANKLSSVSQEDFFFSAHSDTEMHKYQFYPNTYMKYNNKKMGNLFFTFMFKHDRINFSDDSFEYYDQYKQLSSRYLFLFSKKDKLLTFKEEPTLELEYYDVRNCNVKTNTPSGGFHFNSLKDIKEIEVSAYLKSENVPIEKLLELMSEEYISKYELYNILNKLHDYQCKKEFNEEKLVVFKEKITKIAEDLKDNREMWDNITIPFIFNLLRKTFFKVNKPPAKDNKRAKKSEANIGRYTPRDVELMKHLFETSFNFIKPKLGMEISLSALNYIYKNIEENFVISSDQESSRVGSEDYFIYYIISNKKYNELCDLLMYMSNNPACTLPVTTTLMKILKMKKAESKELISIIKQDRFKEVLKEILKTHDCHSHIMTNIFCILYHIIEYIELDELFQIVNISKLKEVFITFKLNGFDQVHEAAIYLIKSILVKKSFTSQRININAETPLLDDSDYTEMMIIFSSAIIFIRNKILIIHDFGRLARSLFSLLSHLYTICNIINNINEKNALKAHKVCIEKRMPELLIECLNTINDKKVFTCIDNGFDKFDTSSITTKMIIFRTLYHCILLIQTLKKIEQKTITKFAAEKLYKLIKTIEDNDNIYNPQEIVKQHEKFNKRLDETFKTNLKNLLEYYNRYKQKLPEIADELISILKNK